METNGGLPVYKVSQQKGTAKSKTYALQRKDKSPFMFYGQQYIRKSTALYLLQENISLSNDRLLRVKKPNCPIFTTRKEQQNQKLMHSSERIKAHSCFTVNNT